MSERRERRQKRGRREKIKYLVTADLSQPEKNSQANKKKGTKKKLKVKRTPDENNPSASTVRPLVKPPCAPAQSVPSRRGNADWCKCGKCVAMPTEMESVCCKEIPKCNDLILEATSCIADNSRFHVLCLSACGASVPHTILGDTENMRERAYYNRSSVSVCFSHIFSCYNG
ncbi:uncharacterized protein LOC134572478 isoform X2 [Pelobates fuscus]|uniref:uncharacterized protein LOC134572478 isoform X2 n=1 Tax=Pelobates fuscus TaxID=191477 RepID=UPI002FE4E067